MPYTERNGEKGSKPSKVPTGEAVSLNLETQDCAAGGTTGEAVSSNSGTRDSKPPAVSRLPDEAPRFDWSRRYDDDLHAAYRMVARHVYPQLRLGEFAYLAFDYINATFFENKLPATLIL